MGDILSVLLQKPGIRVLPGASADEIDEAEDELGLKFSEEYKTYLAECGSACFEGVELTGICPGRRLNVVNVTQFERELNPKVPEDLYVVSRVSFEGLVIWQSQNGKIYQSAQDEKPTEIESSLTSYICDR